MSSVKIYIVELKQGLLIGNVNLEIMKHWFYLQSFKNLMHIYVPGIFWQIEVKH